MLRSTVDELRCPKCTKKSTKVPLNGTQKAPILRLVANGNTSNQDVRWGQLVCTVCGLQYPILDGVAVVMENLRDYLFEHAKGIARVLSPDARELPKDLRRDFLDVLREQREISRGQIESDLESDRVMALYLMNHYLRANEVPLTGALSDEWVSKYWDHGPFEKVQAWANENRLGRVVELGCGVGGVGKILASIEKSLDRYLGIDTSFASIHWARKVAFEGLKNQRVPFDLMQAQLGREVAGIEAWAPRDRDFHSNIDFVVGDLALPPVEASTFDVAIAMNAIDMLDDPSILPAVQSRLLKKNGVAVQSDPYIWNERAAKKLRSGGGTDLNSAKSVMQLYERSGFKIEHAQDQIPWLFFKNARQIELYSVHLFFARKF